MPSLWVTAGCSILFRSSSILLDFERRGRADDRSEMARGFSKGSEALLRLLTGRLMTASGTAFSPGVVLLIRRMLMRELSECKNRRL